MEFMGLKKSKGGDEKLAMITSTEFAKLIITSNFKTLQNHNKNVSMIIALMAWAMPIPSYHISGSHLDIKGDGTVTSNDIRTKTQYTEMVTCTIHEGITDLGDNSFYGCSKLSSITLPETLLKISRYSFGHTNLKNITIPKNLKELVTINTFFRIEFEEFFVHPENRYFTVFDGCLYSHNLSILISVPNKKKSIIFSNYIDEIGPFCFWASEIKCINIPDTVKKINFQSFVDPGLCTSVIFGEDSLLEQFPTQCFQSTSVVSFAIPPKVNKISSDTFYYNFQRVTFLTNSTLQTLESRSFVECKSLKSVSLPKSIKYIDPLAFFGCTKLTKIEIENDCEFYSTNDDGILFSAGYSELVFAPPEISYISIPNSTKTISIGILQKLTNVPIESVNVSKDNNYFEYLSGIIYSEDFTEAKSAIGSLKDALIHSNTTKLCDSLFEGVIGLQTIRFDSGSNCTTVGDRFCCGCTQLTTVEFPSTITSFGIRAFKNTGINSIVIPKGVTALSLECFYESQGLTSVTFEGGSRLTILNTLCFARTSFTSIDLPDRLITISYRAFYFSKIHSVRIPDSVETMDNNFAEGSYVYEVIFTVNSSLKKLTIESFLNCIKLHRILIPPSINVIESSCFKNCIVLQIVEFLGESNLSSIPSLVFEGCTSLESISLPASIQSVDASSFFGCLALKTITPEAGSKYSFVDYGLYSDEMKVLSLFVPGVERGSVLSSAETIGPNAFYGDKKLQNLEFKSDSKLTSIGANTFYGCSALESLMLPASLQTIDSGCFRECENLHDWRIHDQSLLTGIGDKAFDGCSSLTVVDFGENSQLKSIGVSSFAGCKKLCSISIPPKVSSIGESAFDGCSALAEVTFEYGPEHTGLAIPNACFRDCIALRSIDIPKRVTKIGDRSFMNCHNLKSAKFENGLTSIGDQSFSGCSLVELELPNSTQSLGSQCFFSNTKLTKVISSASALTIGDYCFSQCSSLELVAFCSEVEIAGKDLFQNSGLAFIFVVASYPGNLISGIAVSKTMQRCLVFPTKQFSAFVEPGNSIAVIGIAHLLYEDKEFDGN